MTLTIGSLFSGIGGLERGLELAGLGPVLWQVERDPFCREVLAKHWPEARRFPDVRTLDATDLPSVDLVCGGFPCQDVSDAGKKKGVAAGGQSGGLWREFARIVEAKAPRFVVLENVASLVQRGLARVLGDLASLGYDAEWSCFSACAVGAPHSRDRLFLVAYAHEESESALAVDEEMAGVPSDAIAMRDLWLSMPEPRRMAHGLSDGLDRLRALGNAVVPACGAVAGARVMVRAGKR